MDIPEAVLDNWSIVGLGIDLYKPLEEFGVYLCGEVYGHHRHKDGNKIITSAVMHADGRTVMTMNTKYTLNKIDASYKQWYFDYSGIEINEDNPFPD